MKINRHAKCFKNCIKINIFRNKLNRRLLYVLIIDDFGIAPLIDTDRRYLLEVVEERHGHRSTIITSHSPIDNWRDSTGDHTIDDSILDRLIHDAHKINLKEDL